MDFPMVNSLIKRKEWGWYDGCEADRICIFNHLFLMTELLHTHLSWRHGLELYTSDLYNLINIQVKINMLFKMMIDPFYLACCLRGHSAEV